ncbi:lytic murein transglycosylase [Nocardioides sp.]|uniref:lytic murein transglycosylase n=1 Tax=Nocardioides sp. TaxID=35761 RepID=UPI00351718F0
MTLPAARARRAATLAPLALLSGAWTCQLMADPTVLPVASGLPVPGATPALPAPATSTPLIPTSIAPMAAIAGDGSVSAVFGGRTVADIPAAALAAYQRAETVMRSADASCRLRWQMLAAVGRVESDHGQAGGSVLGADGRATPAILGPRLTGRGDVARITDTDAGELDGDTVYDRAVGPMQFLPATWAQVGVDGDDDGVRDPQDLDDAALAAGVYLCSGPDSLADAPGLRGALLRYNPSGTYADTVIGLYEGYLADPGLTLPSTTTLAGAVTPVLDPDPLPGADDVEALTPQDDDERGEKWTGDPGATTPGGGGHGSGGSGGHGGSTGTDDSSVDPTAPEQPGDPSDQGGEDSTGEDDGTDAPGGDSGGPGGPGAVEEPEPGSLTAEEAAEYCTALGEDEGWADDPKADDDEYDECIAVYVVPTDPSDPTDPSGPSDTADPSPATAPGGAPEPARRTA